jgi:hypothetical protein
MPGSRWTAGEYDIILFYNQHNYRDEDAQSELLRVGKSRSIVAIRSKLAELKKVGTLYDRNCGTWIEQGVGRLVEQMREGEEE